MARKTKKPTRARTLRDDELKRAAGGQFIDPKTKMPNYTGPKPGDWIKGKSIAQTDTIDNTDGLP